LYSSSSDLTRPSQQRDSALLSGKHRRNASSEGRRQLAGWTEPPIRDEERLWAIVDTLVEIAGEHKVSAARVALAWTLGRPAVASAIIGGRNEAQLHDNLDAANLALSADQRARLDKVSAPPLLYPYWLQVQTASDRLGNADLSLLRPHLKA
jgi:aryl-alcohol dehydrogenase-like predicted oxidoreductase